jgi:hypothetical protein
MDDWEQPQPPDPEAAAELLDQALAAAPAKPKRRPRAAKPAARARRQKSADPA